MRTDFIFEQTVWESRFSLALDVAQTVREWGEENQEKTDPASNLKTVNKYNVGEDSEHPNGYDNTCDDVGPVEVPALKECRTTDTEW